MKSMVFVVVLALAAGVGIGLGVWTGDDGSGIAFAQKRLASAKKALEAYGPENFDANGQFKGEGWRTFRAQVRQAEYARQHVAEETAWKAEADAEQLIWFSASGGLALVALMLVFVAIRRRRVGPAGWAVCVSAFALGAGGVWLAYLS